MDAPAPGRAWITGAGKGIGRALALDLARDGWTVAASARTGADLEALAAEASAAPGAIRAYPLDVTDEKATTEAVRRIEADLGPLDLAVLNAGTHIPVTAGRFETETFRRLIDVNLLGTVYGLAAVLPGFKARRGGRIAIVASLAGYRGLPTSAAYGATKAGLINMAEALKPELDRFGVGLTLINPGFVETPLTDKNPFPMPFLIPVEDAVRAIRRGLAGGRFEIAFPWRFAFLMGILRILPDGLLFRITRRLVADD